MVFKPFFSFIHCFHLLVQHGQSCSSMPDGLSDSMQLFPPSTFYSKHIDAALQVCLSTYNIFITHYSFMFFASAISSVKCQGIESLNLFSFSFLTLSKSAKNAKNRNQSNILFHFVMTKFCPSHGRVMTMLLPSHGQVMASYGQSWRVISKSQLPP